jgi:hypothetical protein
MYMDNNTDASNPDVDLTFEIRRDSSWMFYTPGQRGLFPTPYIDPKDMKRLREALGASPDACKKALEACLGDFDAAYEYLRKKG